MKIQKCNVNIGINFSLTMRRTNPGLGLLRVSVGDLYRNHNINVKDT